MRRTAILSLVCLCGRTVELAGTGLALAQYIGTLRHPLLLEWLLNVTRFQYCCQRFESVLKRISRHTSPYGPHNYISGLQGSQFIVITKSQ